jgi:UDP-N-acetylmuramate dehydrogenase
MNYEELRNKFPKADEEDLKKWLEFKKIPAGWLIDKLELRGKKIGGAMISEKHANFIINTGEATADNILALISLIKTKARDTFGIKLDEEIEYVGF